LGRLVAGLKARGLFEKTVLLIAGDHGEAFGEHPGNHGHTLQIREENVKVPLLVVAPGLIEGPVWAGGIASLVDCAPTLLDLVGLEPPRSWEGCSLFRAAPDVACFLTDYDRRWLGLRDGRWKFLWDLDAARGHLYDLMTDPDERYDLARVEPGRVERYRRHVVGWAAANQ
jgi:arylsulfatase A-like enzyme